jgi:hypothetical protein
MDSTVASSFVQLARQGIELRLPHGIPSWQCGRRDADGPSRVAEFLPETQGGKSRGLNRAMRDEDKINQRAAGRSVDGNGSSSSLDRGFDRWLNRQLHVFYDPVLDQKVPDDIATLLELFESRDTQPGNEDEGKY